MGAYEGPSFSSLARIGENVVSGMLGGGSGGDGLGLDCEVLLLEV